MKSFFFRIIVFSAFLGSFPLVNAQSRLFVPAEMTQAYESGTRKPDGNPGSRYWINRAEYHIQADFDPDAGTLRGSEKVKYFNQSPDVINQLVVRLYPDLLKKGGIREMQFSPELISEGVIVRKLVINDTETDLSETESSGRSFWRTNRLSRSGTNMFIPLEKNLRPGESVDMYIEWEVTFPRGFQQRMGAFGPRTWFVAYWYPQIAVYDDIDGWDRLNYTAWQEMYNDFHDYEVEITLPGQTLLWATGELQNPDEVLLPKFRERLKQAATSDEVVKVVSEAELTEGPITPEKPQITWKFSASHVPDFAFCLSDSLVWDATSTETQKGKRVAIHAAYDPKSPYYEECAAIARKSVIDMQENIPGLPYPYPQVTVFQADQGGGGMEFPMLCNDGRVRNRADLIDLTYHEIAHTWFPFVTGINERKYAWMDEGWANIFPNDLAYKEDPQMGDPMYGNVLSYTRIAGTIDDLPLITPSKWLNGWPYFENTYYKPSCAFHTLRDMLGDEMYKKCIQTFILRWEGKHPLPWDFFNTFNDVSGKNLDWFWKAWFFDYGYPDLALGNVSVKGKNVHITVEKRGSMPIPVYLKIIYEDETGQELYTSAEVWAKGKDFTVVSFRAEKPIREIVLGHESFPDTDPGNQQWFAPKP
ncbi:MAG: M1 family metallopeptidase [Bacteroidia bacterium]